MFHALGADFINNVQPDFKRFFDKNERYPLLSCNYSSVQRRITELGLAMQQPTAFSVCHAYADIGSRGKSDLFHLDMTFDDLLKCRGVIK